MPELQKGVLLDMDGIFFELVNHFGEYGVGARIADEIAIVDGLAEPLDELVKLGYVIVGHTNQPDIARGKITMDFLDSKHRLLQEKYPQIGEIFVCIHAETDLCDCRKPKPGLLRQAAIELGLDFSTSWVIGDSRGDIEAAVMVHTKSIFVQTAYNCGSPAIDIATAVVKSTQRALSLIVALDKGKMTT